MPYVYIINRVVVGKPHSFSPPGYLGSLPFFDTEKAAQDFAEVGYVTPPRVEKVGLSCGPDCDVDCPCFGGEL